MAKKKRMAKRKELVDTSSYTKVFELVKADIQQSQLRAALAVTKELILLYWRIGKVLSDKTKSEGWGAKTLERLARDIKMHFPDIYGFSIRNLQYMRKFAESCRDDNYAAAAAQIPWGHNMLLLDKIPDDPAQRAWYIQQTVVEGWSRSDLEAWKRKSADQL
jgi:predicted nuclease of restriction endonuclease-like (RecB) superfamily